MFNFLHCNLQSELLEPKIGQSSKQRLPLDICGFIVLELSHFPNPALQHNFRQTSYKNVRLLKLVGPMKMKMASLARLASCNASFTSGPVRRCSFAGRVSDRRCWSLFSSVPARVCRCHSLSRPHSRVTRHPCLAAKLNLPRLQPW